MFHKLARKHYFELETISYPITQKDLDEKWLYLNLNINSQSTSIYRFYPKLKNTVLAKEYLHALCRLEGIPRDILHINEDNILFTQGIVESIDLIIRAFCEPKKESILVTPPTFTYYAYRAIIENVAIMNVPLEGEDYNVLNVQKIIDSKAKVLFLCSPNNPVGTTLDLKEVEKICQQFTGIVVCDEAYIEWSDRPSMAKWIEKYDNLIVLRTFSKIWALAGVRCGVAIAHKNIIDLLNFTQPLFNFPDSSTHIIASKMKEIEDLFVSKAQLVQLRAIFFDFLIKLPCVEKIYPSAANFLLVKFKDAREIEQILLKAKILVNNTSYQIPNTLRISIGSIEEINHFKDALLVGN